MSQFFASGGRSTGASASASVFPVNIQDWFPSGLTGLSSLQSKYTYNLYNYSCFVFFFCILLFNISHILIKLPFSLVKFLLSCFSCIWLCAALWTVACQDLLSVASSRQGYWNGLPFPSSGDLPNPGSNLCLLYLLNWQVASLPLAPFGQKLPVIEHCIWLNSIFHASLCFK